jgi:hypothetical protein
MLSLCAALIIAACASGDSPLPHRLTIEQYNALNEFAPHQRRDFAMIAWCESRWRPGVVGDKGKSHGAFQVQPRFWGTVPATLRAQARHAAGIAAKHGTKPWTTRMGCKGWLT